MSERSELSTPDLFDLKKHAFGVSLERLKVERRSPRVRESDIRCARHLQATMKKNGSLKRTQCLYESLPSPHLQSITDQFCIPSVLLAPPTSFSILRYHASAFGTSAIASWNVWNVFTARITPNTAKSAKFGD